MSIEKKNFYQAFWWLEHQRIFFFGAFAFGTVAILSLKLMSVEGYVVAAIAVLIMFVYAVLGSRHRVKLRLDVLGDNLYYLGFLFTLVSLSYSLHQLGSKSQNIDQLLENFGLAISTTLTGLALRVFFNQPQANIDEYENAVRLSLTEATANFVGETSHIALEITTLRTVLGQLIVEAKESQKQTTKSLNKAVETQISLLDKASTSSLDNINKLLININSIQNDFGNDLQKNSTALTQVITESMMHIRGGADNFAAGFNTLNNSTDQLRKTLNFLNETLKTWDGTISTLLSNNSDIQSSLKISVQLSNDARATFDTAINELPSTINRATSSLGESLSNISTKLDAGAIDLAQTISSFSIATQDSTSQIKRFQDQIANLNTTLQSIPNAYRLPDE